MYNEIVLRNCHNGLTYLIIERGVGIDKWWLPTPRTNRDPFNVTRRNGTSFIIHCCRATNAVWYNLVIELESQSIFSFAPTAEVCMWARSVKYSSDSGLNDVCKLDYHKQEMFIMCRWCRRQSKCNKIATRRGSCNDLYTNAALVARDQTRLIIKLR